MANHPIEGLMTTAMDSIKDMVDVNTIVGDAVQAPDGTVIIPISRVAFGFAAGGGEYSSGSEKDDGASDEEACGSKTQGKYPFAGGSGAGVSINPVAFMVVGQEQIRLLPVNLNTSVDKILDMVPDILGKANDAIKKKMMAKKEAKAGDGEEKRDKKEKNEEDE